MEALYNLPNGASQIADWPVTVTTASTQAVPVNAANNRLSLRFHNPGTVDVYVCPDQTAQGVAQPAVAAGPGMILVIAGATIDIDSTWQNAWNCIAASSAVLTVLEMLG